MSPKEGHPLADVKALTFDVFGTAVNWRLTVTEELILRSHLKFSSPTLPSDLETKLESIKDSDWGRFGQEWRDSYWKFVTSFRSGQHEFKTIDDHHRDSLIELLEKWGLQGMYTENEILSLSLVWHRLQPCEDAAAGLGELSKGGLVLSTLSNANTRLLQDLVDFGNLTFDHLLCSETFKAFKPAREVYLGAAQALGLQPGQIAMVACHLMDLQAAREAGFRTIYVEREGEEKWDADQIEGARGWVDLWIGKTEGGFLELAKRLAEISSNRVNGTAQ